METIYGSLLMTELENKNHDTFHVQLICYFYFLGGGDFFSRICLKKQQVATCVVVVQLHLVRSQIHDTCFFQNIYIYI